MNCKNSYASTKHELKRKKKKKLQPIKKPFKIKKIKKGFSTRGGT